MFKSVSLSLAVAVVCAVFVLHTAVALSQETMQPKKILAKKCTFCHSLGKVEKNLGKKDRLQWQTTLEKMRSKGAKISYEEQQDLAAYLSGLKAGDAL